LICAVLISHFLLVAGENCITFGGNHFTGLLNKNVPIGPVAGDGILFQSFIINGDGVYQYGATQIPDGECNAMHYYQS
jgi:hypothetical protein